MARELLHRRVLVSGIFLALVAVLVAVLLEKSEQVAEEASKVSGEVYRTTMYRSAASLRELWELNGRPAQLDIDGIPVSFSPNGVPVVRTNGVLDCGLIWTLFTTQDNRDVSPVMDFDGYIQKSNLTACFYKISRKNLLVLRYESGRIMINEILTLNMPQK